jgi:ribonucleoside-triphosphate reductase
MSKEKRLQELKKELQENKGSECEVYSRVVGYHSPANNWNEGKKEEFKNRETFEIAK